MGDVLGADPDQLEALAGRFERRAGDLASSRSSLTSMLSSVPWVGADADRFRSTWRREQSRHIDLVVDELREMAARLRREAADQRTTSGGSALGTSRAPGPGTAGEGSPADSGPHGAGRPDEVAHRTVAAIDPTSRAVRRALVDVDGPTLADLRPAPSPDGGVAPTEFEVPPVFDQPRTVASGQSGALPAPLGGDDWTLPVRDPDTVRAELARWW